MPPLVVDPAALDGAGIALAAVGDGLTAAVGALTSGFGANTGQDAAGEAFGLGYQDAAKSVLKAAAAGINAFRRVGFLVQVSASNYSKAEAASTLGGGAAVLPMPTQPGEFAAPGAPWTLGPGVPEPALWAVVEAFVGDFWPNGDPAQMHAAAACWRTFGAALAGVKDALGGPNSVVDAQQIPERAQIEQAFSKLGADTAGIGAQCDKLAKGLDDFADEVAHAQNAIRDLLHRLGTPSGLWHEVVEVFKGHGLDEVKKIADDIKAVLHNLGREAEAKQQLLQHATEMLDSAVQSAERQARQAWTHFLGEDVGNPVATYFDTIANAGEGVLKELVLAPAQQLEQLNPMRFAYNPQGAAATWEGTAKGLLNMVLLSDPSTAPLVDAFDPQARLNLDKQLVHAEDWRRDRPGLGAGENLADGLLLFTGLGEVGAAGRSTEAAGAAGKAELEAGERGAVGRGAGEAGGVMGRSGALGEISKTTGGLTTDLDNIGKDLPKPDPAAGGRPAGLPPPGPGEPPVGSAPHPVEPAPTPSAPRELPLQPGDRIPGPAADHPPAPAAPGGAEPPIGPREPAPIGAQPGPAPGGANEPTPVFASQHPASAPAVPAERLPSPGAGLGPPPRAPIMSDPPAQPTLASVHSPQSAPISPPRGPVPDPYPGTHPPEPPEPQQPGGPGGGADGYRGGGGGSGAGDGHGRGAHRGDGSAHDSHQSGDGSPTDHGDTSSTGLTDEKRDEILAMEKGTRPDPSEYLAQEYIEHHLEQFNQGGTRFMLSDTFEDFGIGQVDGTTFVFPTSEIDALMEATKGNPAALEKALGLPEGYFKDNVMRVDISDLQRYNLRIPSGNEAGANKYWLPGGFLPQGMPEAVIDGAKVPAEDLIKDDYPLLERK